MGRLVLVSLGVLTIAAIASRAADPASLKGTWVRESMVGPTMGNQVILTFTDHRVTARLRSGGRDPGGHEGWITFEFEGEYARTDSGLLVGTITGMNVDLSQIPEGDSPGEPLGKSVAKMIGEPFCFRARVSDGALTVTDLKVPDVKIDDEHSSREMIAGFASGKYVSSPTENVPVPKLKAAKAIPFNRTRLAGNLTTFMWLMSRPGAILSNPPEPPVPANFEQQPTFDPPVPAQLPRVISAAPPLPGPMPLPSPMAMPNPVPMMPQPLPSAMPAPFAMAPQPKPTVIPMSAMPQSLPPAVRAEMLMNQSEGVIPLGSGPWMPLPPTVYPTVIKMTEIPSHSGETVLREIDLGVAGTMQVIVRMKGGNAKPMMPAPISTIAPMRVCPPETVCPSPSLVSQLPMLPPVQSTLIPTAGQLMPPGSMRNVPVMPAIADAWKQSTAPVVK